MPVHVNELTLYFVYGLVAALYIKKTVQTEQRTMYSFPVNNSMRKHFFAKSSKFINAQYLKLKKNVMHQTEPEPTPLRREVLTLKGHSS